MTSVLGCSRPSLPPPMRLCFLTLLFPLLGEWFLPYGHRACAEGCAVGVCQCGSPLGGLMRTCAGSSSKVGKSWMQIPPVFSQSPEIFRGARCAGLARRCCGIVVRIAEACMHRMQLTFHIGFVRTGGAGEITGSKLLGQVRFKFRCT
jgi:hypothetical protein